MFVSSVSMSLASLGFCSARSRGCSEAAVIGIAAKL